MLFVEFKELRVDLELFGTLYLPDGVFPSVAFLVVDMLRNAELAIEQNGQDDVVWNAPNAENLPDRAS